MKKKGPRHANHFSAARGRRLGGVSVLVHRHTIGAAIILSDGKLVCSLTTAGVARCWAALSPAGKMIAELQVDREEPERGYLDIALRPDLRRRGLGTTVLSAFLSGPGRVYPILKPRIEADNTTSLACARSCGFELMPDRDEEGFIRAARRV